MILVGQLLSISLAVFEGGVLNFDWNRLGMLSILIQWIMLSSAACLCPLRPWFRRQKPMVAGVVSYLLVLVITLVFTATGSMAISDTKTLDLDMLLTNLMLAAVFSGTVLRYFYLQQQLRNQQQAELTARIQALQARIRPHFLFNSMNSIASLIDFDPVAAENMVVDLSELFRASLSEPGLIPMTREIELCKRFVAIEHTRIGDRLRVDWSVDGIDTVMVPSLLLQPLVENAIYHGIQPLVEGGVVEVSIQTKGTHCWVKVKNPVGDKKQATNKGNGLALENIYHRLHAHYGSKASINVTQSADCYVVELDFPKTPPVITR